MFLNIVFVSIWTKRIWKGSREGKFLYFDRTESIYFYKFNIMAEG